MIIIIQSLIPVKYFLPVEKICAKIKHSSHSQNIEKGENYGI